jgi:CHASE1-domain containing sensor protein
MTKRQENERALQTRIEQLQREIDNMKYAPVPITTTQSMRAPTPAERYVNPRSRVNRFKLKLLIKTNSF